jgi:hypothetical protein
VQRPTTTDLPEQPPPVTTPQLSGAAANDPAPSPSLAHLDPVRNRTENLHRQVLALLTCRRTAPYPSPQAPSSTQQQPSSTTTPGARTYTTDDIAFLGPDPAPFAGPNAGITEVDLVADVAPAFNAAAALQVVAGNPDVQPTIMAGGRLVMSRGGHAADDYNPSWPLLTHPSVHVMGTGACPQGRSEAAHLQHYMAYVHPPSSPFDAVYLADMVNRLQRHLINLYASVKLKLNPADLRQIAHLNLTDMQCAIRLLQTGLTGAALLRELDQCPDAVKTLMRSFRFVGSHVPGTPGGTAMLRLRILIGCWILFGPCTMMVNLNPPPLRSALVFELLGRKYTFDPAGMPNLAEQPTLQERYHLIARNPHAAAEYFRAFLAAFVHVFYGWPRGDVKQRDPACLFGRITNYFFHAETNQAGDLHAHGCVWQPAMDARRIVAALEDPAAAERLLTFMESVQRTWLPDPAMTAPVCKIDALDPTAEPPILVEPDMQHLSSLDSQPNLLDLADPTKRAACLLLLAKIMCEALNHHHTPTCAPHGGKATDANCRLAMPRLPTDRSMYFKGGLIRLKRRGPMLVSGLHSLLLAQPCNHTVYFIAEASRWVRKVLLYCGAHPDAKATDPALLPLDLLQV